MTAELAPQRRQQPVREIVVMARGRFFARRFRVAAIGRSVSMAMRAGAAVDMRFGRRGSASRMLVVVGMSQGADNPIDRLQRDREGGNQGLVAVKHGAEINGALLAMPTNMAWLRTAVNCN